MIVTPLFLLIKVASIHTLDTIFSFSYDIDKDYGKKGQYTPFNKLHALNLSFVAETTLIPVFLLNTLSDINNLLPLLNERFINFSH